MAWRDQDDFAGWELSEYDCHGAKKERNGSGQVAGLKLIDRRIDFAVANATIRKATKRHEPGKRSCRSRALTLYG